MPSLQWIGKEAVIQHHHTIPFRLLEPIPELSWEPEGSGHSGNLIVQGDNLYALKALLPHYNNQVKCIYIDPPYNTGNEGWVYNDNVNSPPIRQWLGEVVGKEGERLDRHDRWLCMMAPRLMLLRQLLRDDGVIFVSIDDNELSHLSLLMDEVFGPTNKIATIVWEKGKKGDSKWVSVTHEYIVVFARNKAFLKERNIKWRRKKPGADDVLAHYQTLRREYGDHHAKIRQAMMAWYRSLPTEDPRKSHKHYHWSDSRGLYFPDNLAGPDDGRDNRPRYPIIHPVTKQPCAVPSTGWRWEETRTTAALAEDPPRIHFGKDHTTIPKRKSYLSEIDEEPMRSVFYKDGRAATLEVEAILGAGSFPFPKDSTVMADLIGMVVSPGDIVLDSFAGSGSTAHGVLRLNQQLKPPLQFILIEMDEQVARTQTRERVKKVIDGYLPLGEKHRTPVSGLGGGFQFCHLLPEPLFLADGRIRADVTFEQLAAFVWFTETGTGMNPASIGPPYSSPTPYLGQHQRRAVFLLYNGILSDTSDIGGNVLNSHTLTILNEALPDFEGPRVVYGARSRFDKSKLTQLGFTFHPLPYALPVQTWC